MSDFVKDNFLNIVISLDFTIHWRYCWTPVRFIQSWPFVDFYNSFYNPECQWQKTMNLIGFIYCHSGILLSIHILFDAFSKNTVKQGIHMIVKNDGPVRPLVRLKYLKILNVTKAPSKVFIIPPGGIREIHYFFISLFLPPTLKAAPRVLLHPISAVLAKLMDTSEYSTSELAINSLCRLNTMSTL